MDSSIGCRVAEPEPGYGAGALYEYCGSGGFHLEVRRDEQVTGHPHGQVVLSLSHPDPDMCAAVLTDLEAEAVFRQSRLHVFVPTVVGSEPFVRMAGFCTPPARVRTALPECFDGRHDARVASQGLDSLIGYVHGYAQLHEIFPSAGQKWMKLCVSKTL